ncbi:hypothetical protein D3C76_1408300 [compost metagenome]
MLNKSHIDPLWHDCRKPGISPQRIDLVNTVDLFHNTSVVSFFYTNVHFSEASKTNLELHDGEILDRYVCINQK